MNETMVYADGFEKTFATQRRCLIFFQEEGKPQSGIRKPSGPSGWWPLEKEADNLDNETQRWRKS